MVGYNLRRRQTLFEFQNHIDDIPRDLHFISWANIWCFNFQIPDISLDQKSVYNNQIQSAPVHIKVVFSNCHIYTIPKLTNTSPECQKSVKSVVCHIVINYYWASWFLPEMAYMAKVNDNHIQPKSNETPLPPRRRSCFSKKALLRKLSILTLDAIV